MVWWCSRVLWRCGIGGLGLGLVVLCVVVMWLCSVGLCVVVVWGCGLVVWCIMVV